MSVNPPPDPNSTEPALSAGVISAAIAVLLNLVVAFGLPLTDTQQAAIMGIITPLWALATAIYIRSKVWSPASVAKRDLKR